ncbi:Arc family DNA-binding protein [Pseudomonas sp. NPDC007930]|uniref:FitA-like ribbon-helix-helix domain-containing protein n=1 Tax=Pseudomonas sp. NPDC007930 TaxID=3364417 RepID=UPI0036E1C5D6
MPVLTVRNVPDDVHRALRMRAAEHGRSTEAEIRDILANAVKPPARPRMGDALMAIGRSARLTDRDIDALEANRDRTPAEPMGFE